MPAGDQRYGGREFRSLRPSGHLAQGDRLCRSRRWLPLGVVAGWLVFAAAPPRGARGQQTAAILRITERRPVSIPSKAPHRSSGTIWSSATASSSPIARRWNDASVERASGQSAASSKCPRISPKRRVLGTGKVHGKPVG